MNSARLSRLFAFGSLLGPTAGPFLVHAQVKGLPMRSRDITSILDQGTGAASGGTTISLNGLPPRGFSFSVDGVNAVPDSEYASISAYQNDNYGKGVSVEAVQEVEVSRSIFSAEIANTMAGNVNIITQGGANEYQGTRLSSTRPAGSTPTIICWRERRR